MKFACDKCKTRYSIADERVRGRVLKIRCKACNNVITVGEQAETSHSATSAATSSFGDDEHTRVAPPSPDLGTEEWYVSFDGEQEGPFPLSRAQERVRTERGRGKECYCWRGGFFVWLPVDEVPEFAAALKQPGRAAPPAPPIEAVLPKLKGSTAQSAGQAEPATARERTTRPSNPQVKEARPAKPKEEAAKAKEPPAKPKEEAAKAKEPARPKEEAAKAKEPAKPKEEAAKAKEPPAKPKEEAAKAKEPPAKPKEETARAKEPARPKEETAKAKEPPPKPKEETAKAKEPPPKPKEGAAKPEDSAAPRSRFASKSSSSARPSSSSAASPGRSQATLGNGAAHGSPLLEASSPQSSEANSRLPWGAGPAVSNAVPEPSTSSVRPTLPTHSDSDSLELPIDDLPISEASRVVAFADLARAAAVRRPLPEPSEDEPAEESGPLAVVPARAGTTPWMKWAALAGGLATVALGVTVVMLLTRKPTVIVVPPPPKIDHAQKVEDHPITIADPGPTTTKHAVNGKRTTKRPRTGVKGSDESMTAAERSLASLYKSGVDEHEVPRTAPTLDRGSHASGGQVSQQAILAVVTRNRRTLNACYDRVLKHDSSLRSGRVVTHIKIGISGSVTGVSLPDPRYANSELGRCIVQTVKHWHFPASDSEYEMDFPIILQAN